MMRFDHGMNGSGLAVNGAFWDTGQPPSCNVPLPSMGAVLNGLYLSP